MGRRLPSNALGARVADDLRAMGVDVAHVDWTDEGRVGVFFSEPGAAPRPTSVVYDREGSAFAGMCVEHLDADVLDGAAWAMISEIVPAGDAGAALASHFFDAAASRGVAVCLDINHRALLWSAQAAREGLMPSIRRASLVVCAERDARAVFGLAERARTRWQECARWPRRAELSCLPAGRKGPSRASDGTVTVGRAADRHHRPLRNGGCVCCWPLGRTARGAPRGCAAARLRRGGAHRDGTRRPTARGQTRGGCARRRRGRGQHGDEKATIAHEVAR